MLEPKERLKDSLVHQIAADFQSLDNMFDSDPIVVGTIVVGIMDLSYIVYGFVGRIEGYAIRSIFNYQGPNK
jgi:hypothetical protein